MEKSKKIFYKISSVILVGLPSLILAQSNVGTGASSATIPNPFKGGSDLNSLIVTLLNNVVMPIAAVASVFYIIWAGFQYVLAKGNPGKIAEANKNLLWALIGVGVLLGAAGISAVVKSTVESLIN